ncbi:MAG: gliding motility-associated C-terminal domain-containing protein, partial [Bacteroidales bacterium]|nr:gliding motility-associated C-terminal domain-containing protein [Bacteroidales bacterium]
LHGDPSATQSGVIVPRPLHPNLYYIFTVDANIGSNGCQFSVVDMNLNGGFGDIVTGQKNIMLFTPSTEKITAVNHSNGYDIWVITHPWNANYFFVYQVSASGLNQAPIISYTGSNNTGTNDITRGYLKASPSGNYVVAAIEGLDKWEMFNFNATTGQLSLLLSMPANYNSAYGVEFSPDGMYMYGSERWGTPLFQWNIGSGNPAAIMASQAQVGTLSTAYGGALQLAIDNKIYLARSGQYNLGIIHFPNNPGMSCTYVDQGIYLATKLSREGLPTFITSYFNIADFTFSNQCFGDTTTFQITNVQQLDSAHWNFGDPASGGANYSSDWSSTHVFSGVGIFNVELVTFRGGTGDTIVLPIEIYAYPVASLPANSVICLGASITLDAGNPGYEYFWSNAQTSQIISVTPSDTALYSVTVSNHGCETVDAIPVYPYQITSYFTTTQPPCAGQPVSINYTGNAALNATYNWSFSSGNIITGAGQGPYSVNWTTPGTYSVSLQIVEGQCNSPVSTQTVVNPASIDVSITSNDALCHGDATGEVFTSISSGPGFYVYSWNNGANTSDLVGVPAGTYSLTVTYSGVCTKTVSVEVEEPAQPLTMNVLGDNIVCHGDTNGVVSANPSGGTPPYLYYWDSNGETTPAINQLHAGYYQVTVTDSHNCVVAGGGTVSEPSPLAIFSSPDVYICPSNSVSIYATAQGGQPPYTFQWSNGAIGDTISVSPSSMTTYTAIVSDANGCSQSGALSTIYPYTRVQTVLYASNDSICPGESTFIYADFNGGTGGPYTSYYGDGTAVSLPMVFSPSETTTIQIYGMDECEEPGTLKNLTIHVIDKPTVDIASDKLAGCVPLEIRFHNPEYEEDVQYNWRFSGSGDEDEIEMLPSPQHVFANPGVYDVILNAINKAGCTNSLEIQNMITALPNPVGNMLIDPQAVPITKPVVFYRNLTEEFVNQSYWFFGDGDSAITNADELSHLYTDTGVFTVQLVVERIHDYTDYPTITDSISCYDTLSMDVHVYKDNIFFVPNAFHPDGNILENQTFKPFIFGGQPIDYQLYIYNRWGGLIFYSNEYEVAWDGRTENGEMAKRDNYTWMVIYTDAYGVIHQHSGNVLLLRQF